MAVGERKRGGKVRRIHTNSRATEGCAESASGWLGRDKERGRKEGVTRNVRIVTAISKKVRIVTAISTIVRIVTS